MDSEIQQAATVATTEVDKLEIALVKEIKTEEDLALAAQQLSTVKTLQNRLKATRDKFVLPLKQQVKIIEDEMFNPPRAKLVAAEAQLKRVISAYHAAIEAAARKKEAAIEKKVDAGKMDMGTAVNKVAKIERAPEQVQADNGGKIQMRTVRKVRLKDLSKVPVWVFADTRVVAALESVARTRALKEGVSGFEVIETKEPAAYGAQL